MPLSLEKMFGITLTTVGTLGTIASIGYLIFGPKDDAGYAYTSTSLATLYCGIDNLRRGF